MSPIYIQGVEQVASGIPSGLIAMWHGLIANIPSGWIICDGNSGTPNLLAKFVEGVATAATNPGATGGEATHVLTTAELPAHAHALPFSGAATTYGIIASSDRGLTFAGTTSSVGSGSAHENKPPFYDIAFIMKT